STSTWSQDLSGIWILKITNLKNKVIASARIRFSEEKAQSCMAGNWRRVIVDSPKTTDSSFFPASERWSYTVENSELTIGRNEICDDYLHLIGSLRKGTFVGEYVSLGLAGGKKIGYFAVSRIR